jgi:hypothetical protein
VVRSNGPGQRHLALAPRKNAAPSREKVAAALIVPGVGVVLLGPGRAVIEAIERLFAGNRVRLILCGCESCGHLWAVPEDRSAPVRCSRCKSRRWNVVAEREFEPPGPPYQRRVRPRGVNPAAPVRSATAPTEPGGSPAGVRCPRCGRQCVNVFGIKMHECVH